MNRVCTMKRGAGAAGLGEALDRAVNYVHISALNSTRETLAATQRENRRLTLLAEEQRNPALTLLRQIEREIGPIPRFNPLPATCVYYLIIMVCPGKQPFLYLGRERQEPYDHLLNEGRGPVDGVWTLNVPRRLRDLWDADYRRRTTLRIEAARGLETALTRDITAALAGMADVTGGLYALLQTNAVADAILVTEWHDDSLCVRCGSPVHGAGACRGESNRNNDRTIAAKDAEIAAKDAEITLLKGEISTLKDAADRDRTRLERQVEGATQNVMAARGALHRAPEVAELADAVARMAPPPAAGDLAPAMREVAAAIRVHAAAPAAPPPPAAGDLAPAVREVAAAIRVHAAAPAAPAPAAPAAGDLAPALHAVAAAVRAHAPAPGPAPGPAPLPSQGEWESKKGGRIPEARLRDLLVGVKDEEVTQAKNGVMYVPLIHAAKVLGAAALPGTKVMQTRVAGGGVQTKEPKQTPEQRQRYLANKFAEKLYPVHKREGMLDGRVLDADLPRAQGKTGKNSTSWCVPVEGLVKLYSA
jgi:hypothetical protein